MGAEGAFTIVKNAWQRVPPGCAMTGYNFEGDNPGGDTIFYRPIQKYMSTIGRITVGHTARLHLKISFSMNQNLKTSCLTLYFFSQMRDMTGITICYAFRRTP
mgnify:CR=1 FL=1